MFLAYSIPSTVQYRTGRSFSSKRRKLHQNFGIYCILYYFIYASNLPSTHRINTARKEKGWGRHFFHQIEPNWPLPVPRLREARPAGWVSHCSICASIMPRAQNRAGKVQFYCEDDSLFLSSYYLSMLLPFSLFRINTYTHRHSGNPFRDHIHGHNMVFISLYHVQTDEHILNWSKLRRKGWASRDFQPLLICSLSTW